MSEAQRSGILRSMLEQRRASEGGARELGLKRRCPAAKEGARTMTAVAAALEWRAKEVTFRSAAEPVHCCRQHLGTDGGTPRHFVVNLKGNMAIGMIIDRENMDLLCIGTVLDAVDLLLFKGLHSAGEMASISAKGAMAVGPSSVALWGGTDGRARLMTTFD